MILVARLEMEINLSTKIGISYCPKIPFRQ